MRLVIIAVLAVLTACTGAPPAAPAEPPAADAPAAEPASEGDAGGDEAGGPAADEAAPAAEGEGDAAEGEGSALAGLDALAGVQGKVHAMMAKADAQKTLTDALGAPASSSDTEMSWIAGDGTTCKLLKVQLMGDMTGGVTVEDAACPGGSAE